MKGNGLNERLTRLERALAPASSACCAACGLPHARLPIPTSVAQTIVARDHGGRDVAVPRLCLWLPCCSEGHEIARLTHGLPLDGAA